MGEWRTEEEDCQIFECVEGKEKEDARMISRLDIKPRRLSYKLL